MEVSLSPDQEARLSKLAAQRGSEESAIVSEMISHALEYEDWYTKAAEEGEAELDRGEFIEHEEVKARIDRLIQSKR